MFRSRSRDRDLAVLISWISREFLVNVRNEIILDAQVVYNVNPASW